MVKIVDMLMHITIYIVICCYYKYWKPHLLLPSCNNK